MEQKRENWGSKTGFILAAAGSAIANLETTLPAGTVIYLNVTALTLTSGLALCYYEQVI